MSLLTVGAVIGLAAGLAWGFLLGATLHGRQHPGRAWGYKPKAPKGRVMPPRHGGSGVGRGR